jgi:hypothetical protein
MRFDRKEKKTGRADYMRQSTTAGQFSFFPNMELGG